MTVLQYCSCTRSGIQPLLCLQLCLVALIFKNRNTNRATPHRENLVATQEPMIVTVPPEGNIRSAVGIEPLQAQSNMGNARIIPPPPFPLPPLRIEPGKGFALCYAHHSVVSLHKDNRNYMYRIFLGIPQSTCVLDVLCSTVFASTYAW